MSRKEKILFVEDDAQFVTSCRKLLQAKNVASVSCENNSVSVVNAIYNEAPTYVVLDVFLPGFDAIGIMKSINSGSLAKKPNFIVLSGFDTPILRQELKAAGAFYFFPQAPGGDDVAFVNRLVEERVLAVPGSGFGCPGYFRLAFCVDETVIRNAAEGFARAYAAVAGK